MNTRDISPEPHIILWRDELKDAHIDDAVEYVSLFFQQDQLEGIAKKLKRHEKDLSSFKAKDLFRASGDIPLPETDIEVAGHLKKIREGTPLNPVILITLNDKLYIADGFHRICACYIVSSDANFSGVHITL